MKYGVCIGLDDLDGIKLAAETGFDYVEFSFQALSRADDELMDKVVALLSECNFKGETANCFIPNSFALTSDEIDKEALADFIEKGMINGKKVGLETVVFGSGGAKRIPDGVDYGTAFNRLVDFLRDIAAPIAKKYDVTIVVEPLCKLEVNIINTVKEGAILAAVCGMDNVADLADLYHMVVENDSIENIIEVGSLLRHAHISCPKADDKGNKRTFMKDINEYDYKPFIDALRAVGCPRCSIEGRLATDDKKEEYRLAYNVLKQL